MGEVQNYENGVPSWIDLATSDMGAARTFYTAVFGWDLQDAPMEGSESPYVTALVNGKRIAGMIELSGESHANVPPSWTTYVNTDDIEATVSRVSGLGGQVIRPPIQVLDKGSMALITDPTGAMVGLWQPATHTGAQWVNEPNSWTWSELMTTDMAKAEEFWGELFGWKSEPVEGSQVKYDSQMLNGAPVAGVTTIQNPQQPPMWLTYFAVADCDATATTIEQNGGKVWQQPFDIPIGRMAVASDPQGAPFAVIKMTQPPTR